MVDEKGPLIATLQDGTRIYKRGLVDSRGYVEATIGIYNFSSEFNPNTGKWESVAATLALPIGNKIEFQPDGDAMKVSIGGSVPVAGPITIDLAIIIGPDGEISHSIGADLTITRQKIIDGVISSMREHASEFELDRPERAVHFLAQIAHESAHFRTTTEYASGVAYEGRNDLGNTFKGDGQKFRGRGLIQLTGRSNTMAFSQ